MRRFPLLHGHHGPRHDLSICSNGRIPHSLPGLVIGPAYQGAAWLLSKLSVEFCLEIEFHVALTMTSELRVAILDKIRMIMISIVISGDV